MIANRNDYIMDTEENKPEVNLLLPRRASVERRRAAKRASLKRLEALERGGPEKLDVKALKERLEKRKENK